jgi:TPR repeat protein
LPVSFVAVDMKKAMYYYRLSAKQHWFQCERTLGVYYELGLGGLRRSRAAAIVWLTRAMEDGKDGFSQDLAGSDRHNGTEN